MTGIPSSTSGVKNKKRKRKKEDVLSQLLKVINDAKLTPKQITILIPEFLFSIGNHLEGCGVLSTSEEVLLRYAKTPTLGSALMAQALWMRDTWKETTDKKGIKE